MHRITQPMTRIHHTSPHQIDIVLMTTHTINESETDAPRQMSMGRSTTKLEFNRHVLRLKQKGPSGTVKNPLIHGSHTATAPITNILVVSSPKVDAVQLNQCQQPGRLLLWTDKPPGSVQMSNSYGQTQMNS